MVQEIIFVSSFLYASFEYLFSISEITFDMKNITVPDAAFFGQMCSFITTAMFCWQRIVQDSSGYPRKFAPFWKQLDKLSLSK